MQTCCIGLGGNRGDVKAGFRQALDELAGSGFEVIAVSSTYCTRPMGEHAGSGFLNAAAVLKTSLPPQQVLANLHRIEQAAGRRRSVHWGPRTLDLDLLLLDDEVVDSESLVLPHPALWYRRFVLDPLTEIAGDRLHPVFGMSVSALRDRVLQRPLVLEFESLHPEPVDRTVVCQGHNRSDLELRATSPGSTTCEDTFARVVMAGRNNDADDARTQPVHPRDFTIEIPATNAQQALRDVVSAVMG